MTSTDQDGNFRVGDLFTVEQATGIATLNADAFSISGLQELQLGSVELGTAGATTDKDIFNAGRIGRLQDIQTPIDGGHNNFFFALRVVHFAGRCSARSKIHGNKTSNEHRIRVR